MRAILRNVSLRSFRVWQRDLDVYLTNWKTEFLPPLSEPVLYVFGSAQDMLARYLVELLVNLNLAQRH